jgi:CheY-like chemotaxis protein
LAEDDEGVRKVLRHLLNAGGYRVPEGADGRDAFRLFEQHAASIDLLLTDAIMPRPNGRKVHSLRQTLFPGLARARAAGVRFWPAADRGSNGR